MKLIVVSDTHGRDEILYQLQEQYADADAFLHCGDLERDPLDFPGYLMVQGNNDYYYDMPAERVLPMGEHRILLIHSHQFPYRKRNERLAEYARKLGCDIVCYGHTHVADFHREGDVVLLNPGSLKYSRDGREPSYAILKLENGKIGASFVAAPLPPTKHRFF